MIRLAVNIDSTLAELNKFIEAASQFEDCRYYTPQFKLWQENVRSLLKRTYTEKECKDKLSVWNGVQFFSAGLEKLLATVERIDPETSGLALEGNVCEINESKDLKWHLAKYMVYQMMRGDKIREIFNEEGRSLPKESLIRVASYLRYFMAEVVLNSLEQHLSNMNIRLVENSTTEEFLTGDNPVFNLDCSMPPVEFTLFLPISPQRAVVLVNQNIEEKYADILSPTIDKVRELNKRLCNGCITNAR